MNFLNVLISLAMLFAYLTSNVDCRRNSDIIIMGKDGWGSGMGNL